MDSFKQLYACHKTKRLLGLKVSFIVLFLILSNCSSSNAFAPHSSSRCRHQVAFHDQHVMKLPSLRCSPTTTFSIGGRRVSFSASALAASNLPDSSTNGEEKKVVTSEEQVQRDNRGEISWGDQASKFIEMARPYYNESKSGRWLFVGMIALTLMNSGVSVAFSYIGKDFWNALSAKDQTLFYQQLVKYAAALLVGAPVKVLYS